MSQKQRFIVKVDKDQKSLIKRAITLHLAENASLDPDNEETAGEAICAIARQYVLSRSKKTE